MHYYPPHTGTAPRPTIPCSLAHWFPVLPGHVILSSSHTVVVEDDRGDLKYRFEVEKATMTMNEI